MTISEQQIEIPISKKKLILSLIGSLIFVGIGILFVVNPEKYSNPYKGSPIVILIVGIVSIVFFGLLVPFFIKKIGDNSPGLIISDLGILDNSSAVSAGQILWSDIEEISIIEIHRQKIILLMVKNPQDYVDRQISTIKRKMMTMNYKIYGTPLSITSVGLKISFDQLYSTLTNKLNTSHN